MGKECLRVFTLITNSIPIWGKECLRVFTLITNNIPIWGKECLRVFTLITNSIPIPNTGISIAPRGLKLILPNTGINRIPDIGWNSNYCIPI